MAEQGCGGDWHRRVQGAAHRVCVEDFEQWPGQGYYILLTNIGFTTFSHGECLNTNVISLP